MVEGLCLIPKEPYDSETVVRICKAMQQQPGFQDWYLTYNVNRRALRFRENGVEIKGISQTLEDPSPAIDVHITRYVNRIEAADAQIEVSARSVDNAAVKAAQNVEDFYYTFFSDITRQQPGGIITPYRRHLDDMTAYGAGFLHPAFSQQAREALPRGTYRDVGELVAELKKSELFKDGFTENPFIVECPAMGTVFFEDNLSPMCEVGQRTISQLLLSYEDLSYHEHGFEWLSSDTLPEYNADWSDLATYYHLETEEFIYDVIEDSNDNEPFTLDVKPNVAGRPWYTITPGHVNNDPAVSHRFQPLISPLYQTVQTMNVTRTLIQSGALNTGRPMYQEVADGGRGVDLPTLLSSPAEQTPTIIFDPSQQVLKKPRKGYHWELVPAPSIEWVLRAYEESKKDLQDWGFPASLSPDSPTTGQANSAAQGAQQMDVATNYLDPALNNVARSLHVLLTRIGDIIIGLDMPIEMPMHRRGGDSRVREVVRVTPDDFREHDLTVRLESIPAAAQIAINEFELREMQEGLRSRSAYMRRRYRDHLAEQERIILDKALAFAEKKALEGVQQVIQQIAPALTSQVAAEQEIPPVVPQAGGPAEPGQPRLARPAVPVPGAGTPNPIPGQRTNGVPAGAGTEQIVTAQ